MDPLGGLGTDPLSLLAAADNADEDHDVPVFVVGTNKRKQAEELNMLLETESKEDDTLSLEALTTRLVDMGFAEGRVHRALSASGLRTEEDAMSWMFAHPESNPEPVEDEDEDLISDLPPPKTIQDRIIDFNLLFEEETYDVEKIRATGLSGGLRNSSARACCWMVMLGVLKEDSTPNDWTTQLVKHRTDYEILQHKYLTDPHAESHQNLDLALNNPLSQSVDSPWSKFFEDDKIRKQIRLDLERLHPGKAFFRQKWVRDVMLDLLFIYAREHEDLGYRQGMHELLAAVLLTTYQGKYYGGIINTNNIGGSSSSSSSSSGGGDGDDDDMGRKSNGNDKGENCSNDDFDESDVSVPGIIRMLGDGCYVAHDTYVLFIKLMDPMTRWYATTPKSKPKSSSTPYEPFHATFTDDVSMNNPVVKTCRHMQNVLLKDADPQLHRYLHDVDIEPQFYALPWVRLLVSREFHMDDALVIWDALFAYGKDLALLQYIMVAMVMYIRESLLEMDNTGCLRRLFSYPPVEDVQCFIDKALELTSPHRHPAISAPILPSHNIPIHSPLQSSSIIPDVETTELPSSPSASSSSTITSHEKPRRRRIVKKIVRKVKEGGDAALSQVESLTLLKATLDNTKSTQVHMSNRLERIIYTLQLELIENGEDQCSDAVMLAIAELKQIRDILGGNVDVHDVTGLGGEDSSVMGMDPLGAYQL